MDQNAARSSVLEQSGLQKLLKIRNTVLLKGKLCTEEKVMGAKPELSRRETVGPMEEESPDKYKEDCKRGTTEKL